MRPNYIVGSITRVRSSRCPPVLQLFMLLFGSKICEKKLIVVAPARQMCYYNAIKRPNSVAPVKRSRKKWLNLQSTVEIRSEPRSFLPGLIMMAWRFK
jgi:hypothetical protein